MIIAVARKLSNGAPHPYLGTFSSGGTDVPAQILRGGANDISTVALISVTQRLLGMRWIPANWDGYGSPGPNWFALDKAQALLPEFFRGASVMQRGWSNPHVTSNETGDVVLEWWRGPRKITIYVTPTDTNYVRVWGDNIDTEMDEGKVPNARNDFALLWSWLNS